MIVGVVGSGAMGSGIAQVAAMAGEEVRLFDKSSEATSKAIRNIQASINKLVEKEKMTSSESVAVIGRIYFLHWKSWFPNHVYWLPIHLPYP